MYCQELRVLSKCDGHTVHKITRKRLLADWGKNDFCLFPKLRGYRYETIEEMKEAVTKVIDTLTWEDFNGTFQKLLERSNKSIAAT